MKNPVNFSDAVMDEERTHRYSLTRKWTVNDLYGLGGMIMFIGLNPSRADDRYDDPTIRRCIRFSQEWGYAGMYFANLYSFRTPYVKGPMLEKDIAEGWVPLIENLGNACNNITDQYLGEMIKNSKTVVCCWGSWKFTKEREKKVLAMIKEPMCFGRNADGAPKHPLYLPNSAKPERYWA